MKSKIKYNECTVAEFNEKFSELNLIPGCFLGDDEYIVRFVPSAEGFPLFVEIGYPSDEWQVC